MMVSSSIEACTSGVAGADWSLGTVEAGQVSRQTLRISKLRPVRIRLDASRYQELLAPGIAVENEIGFGMSRLIRGVRGALVQGWDPWGRLTLGGMLDENAEVRGCLAPGVNRIRVTRAGQVLCDQKVAVSPVIGEVSGETAIELD